MRPVSCNVSTYCLPTPPRPLPFLASEQKGQLLDRKKKGNNIPKALTLAQLSDDRTSDDDVATGRQPRVSRRAPHHHRQRAATATAPVENGCLHTLTYVGWVHTHTYRMKAM